MSSTAPNPVITVRSQHIDAPHSTPGRQASQPSHLPLFLTAFIAVSALFTRFTRPWIWSGAGLESLLLLHGALINSRAASGLHLTTLLVLLNVAFALAATSWLFLIPFVATCYAAIFLTCLCQYSAVSHRVRSRLRSMFRKAEFFGSTISFFNVPALAIDAEVTGLFVVRGLTLSLSDLTIEAYGLELAIRLNDQMELALCVNHIVIKLFRRITIADVFGNLKAAGTGGSFSVPEAPQDGTPRHSADLFIPTSDFLGYKIPDFSELGSNIDLAGDDLKAEDRHDRILQQIETDSPVCVAGRNIVQGGTHPEDVKEMRQAVCAKLRDVASVSHIPASAVKVSFLQTVFPRTRRFLHRLPLLMRWLLNPLSYFHPIAISSINIAGPGEKIQELLEQHAYPEEASQDEDYDALREQVSSWLGSAHFCLQYTDVAALGQVPLSASNNITVYLRSPDVGLYRTVLETNTVTLVTHIGGADATMVIPAYLLPHHEHCLPAVGVHLPLTGEKSTSDKLDAKYTPAAQDEKHSHEDTKDETEMLISTHATLPSYFDQSLLDIAAALAKATKIIDLEVLIERESSHDPAPEDESEITYEDADAQSVDGANSPSTNMVGRARQAMKHGVKKKLKNNAIGDKLNDRFLARTLGKLAARMEQGKGDFGRSVRDVK